jgi:hypothetical protein
MRTDLPRIESFDFQGFGQDGIDDAIQHVRKLGLALDKARAAVDSLENAERRDACRRELEAVTSLSDDYVEVGLEHLEDEAGFLRHVGILGQLTPEQQERLDEFRADYERRVDALREQAVAVQETYSKVYRAYYGS